MKMIAHSHSLVAVVIAAHLVVVGRAAETPREHRSLDANWKFHLGDDWPDALHLENSGTGSGPASERFADSYWRAVNLPHDWAVGLPLDWAADGSHGFKTLGGKYPTNPKRPRQPKDPFTSCHRRSRERRADPADSRS